MTIAVKLLLLSSCALVLLAFILLMRGGSGRVQAIRRGEVRLEEISLDNGRWPAPLRQWANAFNNQMQLPVLFHALVAMLAATGLADMTSAALGLVFVAGRYAHAWVHVTSNHVPTRGAVFMVGATALALMWIWFAVRVAAA
jgi:hypothetical protein